MASDEEYFLSILLRILWKSLYKYGNGKDRIIAKYKKVKHFGDIIFECSNRQGNSIQMLEIQNMYTKDKRRTTEALSYRCDRLKLESYFKTYCAVKLKLNDQMLSPFEKNTYIGNFLIVKNNDINLETYNLFELVPFSDREFLHQKIKFLIDGVELTKFDKNSKPPQFKNVKLLKLKSGHCQKLLKPFTDRSEMEYEKILETLADLICDGVGGKSFQTDGPKILRPYLYALKREVFEIDPVNKTKLKLHSDFLKSQKKFCGDLIKEILFRKDVKVLLKFKRAINLVMVDAEYSSTSSNLAICLRDGCTNYSYYKKYDSMFRNEIFHITNNSAQGFRKAFIYMRDNNVKLSPTALKFRRPFINYMYCKYGGGKTINEEVLKSIRVERGDHVELIKEKQLPLPVPYLHAFVNDFASVFQIIVNYPDAPELNQLLLAEIRQDHPDESKLLTLLMQNLRERINKEEKYHSFKYVDIANALKTVKRK